MHFLSQIFATLDFLLLLLSILANCALFAWSQYAVPVDTDESFQGAEELDGRFGTRNVYCTAVARQMHECIKHHASNASLCDRSLAPYWFLNYAAYYDSYENLL